MSKLDPTLNVGAEGATGCGNSNQGSVGVMPSARCYVVMGYGGNGITYNASVAEVGPLMELVQAPHAAVDGFSFNE